MNPMQRVKYLLLALLVSSGASANDTSQVLPGTISSRGLRLGLGFDRETTKFGGLVCVTGNMTEEVVPVAPPSPLQREKLYASGPLEVSILFTAHSRFRKVKRLEPPFVATAAVQAPGCPADFLAEVHVGGAIRITFVFEVEDQFAQQQLLAVLRSGVRELRHLKTVALPPGVSHPRVEIEATGSSADIQALLAARNQCSAASTLEGCEPFINLAVEEATTGLDARYPASTVSRLVLTTTPGAVSLADFGAPIQYLIRPIPSN